MASFCWYQNKLCGVLSTQAKIYFPQVACKRARTHTPHVARLFCIGSKLTYECPVDSCKGYDGWSALK